MENTNEQIIYSVNVEDLQAVAKVIYGKELSNEEVEKVSQKLGDYFEDWFDKIELAIEDSLELEKLEEPNWDNYPY